MNPSPDSNQAKLDALLQKMGGQLKKASDLENRQLEISTSLGVADFYPEAQFLGEMAREKPDPEELSRGAWLIRVPLSFDGTPHSSGVYWPGPDRSSMTWAPELAPSFNPSENLEGIAPEEVATLDVECTGLSGGVSVYPFLVGLGYWEKERYVVEQYFLEDLPGEETLLRELARRLEGFKALFTFNGKAFDVPLLESRYMMNRLPSPFRHAHVDLLHPARRLWRGHFPSCSLGSLEREIFQMRRVSDVPGALVPRIYLEYLKGIRRSQIVPVIDHNAQDIASTAALFPLFCRLARSPEDPLLENPVSQLGLAAWARRRKDEAEGLAAMERAVLLSRDPREEQSLALKIAREYRRLERYADCVQIWKERTATAMDAMDLSLVCIEAAKHFEHDGKDFAEALRWVELALERWGKSRRDRQRDFFGGGPEEADLSPEERMVAALEHRRNRLERRLGKEGSSK